MQAKLSMKSTMNKTKYRVALMIWKINRIIAEVSCTALK